MVSSALQERMAAFEKGGPKVTPMSKKISAFQKGNVSNATKNYKSSRDLAGIEAKSDKSWENRSKKSNNTPSWVDNSGSVKTGATPSSVSKKVGYAANGRGAETKSNASTGTWAQKKAAKADDKSTPAPPKPSAKEVAAKLKKEQKQKEKEQKQKEKEQKQKEKAEQKQKEKERKQQEKERKKQEKEQKKKEKEENAEPVDQKQRKKQIAKCLAMAILIIACIVILTITIVTGWGDGSIVVEFEKQAEVLGKLVSLSQSGFVAVVEDDFGFNQVYRLDNDASPKWQPMGMQFRSQGRVQVSGDGSRLAYVNPRTKRLVFEKYDEVLRDWVNTQDAPILGGDDISLSGDFSKLCVGSYGQGSITLVNSKVGEGTITTYEYDGESWLAHGGPLMKIFGMNWFGLSPDGKGLLIMADHDGNVTLDGYQSTALGNNTFEWLKSDRSTTFPSTEVDVAVSNGGYAVSTAKSAQAYTYSGRTMGQEISASGSNNITSVALSTDGRTMVVGSVTPGLTGLVDWYRFPAGTSDNWEVLGEALQDNAAFFGSAVQLNQGSSQVAVQSDSGGNANVHFFEVEYSKHRAIG